MRKQKYTAARKKVKKKILLFALALLCITLLRSQIPSHGNLALNSNLPHRSGAGADNTQSSSQPFFSSAAGRFPPADLQFANNQPEDAVGYILKKAGEEIGTRRGQPHPPRFDSSFAVHPSQYLPRRRMLRRTDWLDELIEKIWFVESTNRLNPPDGDGGNAIGPLQIHQCVLDDVNKRYGTNFVREDLRKLTTARIVARLYISMWMESHKEEIAARIFNGGPRGWRKKSTDTYWQDIQRVK